MNIRYLAQTSLLQKKYAFESIFHQRKQNTKAKHADTIIYQGKIAQQHPLHKEYKKKISTCTHLPFLS